MGRGRNNEPTTGRGNVPLSSLALVPFLSQKERHHQQPQHTGKDGFPLKLGRTEDEVLPSVFQAWVVERGDGGLEVHPQFGEVLDDERGHRCELAGVFGGEQVW